MADGENTFACGCFSDNFEAWMVGSETGVFIAIWGQDKITNRFLSSAPLF